jgi:hypothetical protein
MEVKYTAFQGLPKYTKIVHYGMQIYQCTIWQPFLTQIVSTKRLGNGAHCSSLWLDEFSKTFVRKIMAHTCTKSATGDFSKFACSETFSGGLFFETFLF